MIVGAAGSPDAGAAVLWAVALLLFSAVAVDVLRTVLDVTHGGGPVTGRVGREVWLRLVSWHHRGMPGNVLRVFGLLLTVSVVGTWLVALIAGWSLIYHASDSALLSEATGAPAGAVDRVYFAAASLFSLSLGDVVPGSSAWRLAAAANVGSGLLVLTLSITYAVPVIEAVIRRRVFASTVSVLGGTVSDIVANHLHARGASPLLDELPGLRKSIIELAHLHLAYPVLHYFHSSDRSAALGPNLAALYDALATLEFACIHQHDDRTAMSQTRRVIEAFLDPFLLEAGGRRQPPALPKVACPRHPEVGYDAEALQRELAEPRAKLAAFAHEEGWTLTDPPDLVGGHVASVDRD